MGLDIAVGVHTELTYDPAMLAEVVARLARVNVMLTARGFPVHVEPENPTVSCAVRVGSYTLVHAVRNLAASVALGLGLPTQPLGEEQDNIEEYFSRELTRYEHLVVQSESEGFYLPMSLAHVFVPEDEDMGLTPIGSSIALLGECRDLLRVIGREGGLPDVRDSSGRTVPDGRVVALQAIAHCAEVSRASGAALVYF